jgi:hypothetical protein
VLRFPRSTSERTEGHGEIAGNLIHGTYNLIWLERTLTEKNLPCSEKLRMSESLWRNAWKYLDYSHLAKRYFRTSRNPSSAIGTMGRSATRIVVVPNARVTSDDYSSFARNYGLDISCWHLSELANKMVSDSQCCFHFSCGNAPVSSEYAPEPDISTMRNLPSEME